MLKLIDNLIALLRTMTWIMPNKMCGMCGELPDRRIAHHTGDGWLLAWECPSYCGWEELFIEDWPFIRNYVYTKDLEFIGFEVV